MVMDVNSSSSTRRAWHAVAELVLAGPQHRRSGTIRLTVVPGGFATTRDPQLRVIGGDLVTPDLDRVPIDAMSCAELAAKVGVDCGAPVGLYHDGGGVGPDDTLAVDRAAADEFARAFLTGDAALRSLAGDVRPVLWPEHFDVAVTLDEVNYGVSLGDGYLDEPYAYVAPWNLPPQQPRSGPFWNAPFGAVRTLRAIPAVDEVTAFYREGQAHL
jgi:hypothetical protein